MLVESNKKNYNKYISTFYNVKMDYDISGKYIILFFIKEKVKGCSKGKEKSN